MKIPHPEHIHDESSTAQKAVSNLRKTDEVHPPILRKGLADALTVLQTDPRQRSFAKRVEYEPRRAVDDCRRSFDDNLMNPSDTIVAVASPSSSAIRGVVRVSGEQTSEVLSRVGVFFPETSAACRFSAQLSFDGFEFPIDADVLYWPTQRSYTGQPSAEIHTCGALPVLESLVGSCIRHGARAAQRGEFTLRAFLAGRLDLTQAEAVLGVIEADDQDTFDHALSQLAGNLSKPLTQIRNELLDLLADVEAGLDFVDEDIEFIADEVLVQRLKAIVAVIESAENQMIGRGDSATRLAIVLRGEPNAGKSSLLNALTGRDAAIVTDAAGTTRDIVTIESSVAGHSVRWLDTAGIENARDPVMSVAQEKASEALRFADIRIWCVDASRTDLSDAKGRLTKQIAEAKRTGTVDLQVQTKTDLSPSSHKQWISCTVNSASGLKPLMESIQAAVESLHSESSSSSTGTSARCSQSMRSAREAVIAAIAHTESGTGHEFVSAELRMAAQCVGEVTGEIYNDDILDRVFGRFCIGK